jgi:hypothetical protein
MLIASLIVLAIHPKIACFRSDMTSEPDAECTLMVQVLNSAPNLCVVHKNSQNASPWCMGRFFST